MNIEVSYMERDLYDVDVDDRTHEVTQDGILDLLKSLALHKDGDIDINLGDGDDEFGDWFTVPAAQIAELKAEIEGAIESCLDELQVEADELQGEIDEIQERLKAAQQ